MSGFEVIPGVLNGRHVTHEIADVRRDIFTLVGRIATGEVPW